MSRHLLVFLCVIMAAVSARAEGSGTPPVGSAKCVAFGNMLNDARHRSRGNENFSIEQPEKTLRYIEYATNDLEILKPVGGWLSVPSDVEEVREAIATLGVDFRPRQWTTEPGEAMVVYYEDFNLDYEPDLAFERGDPRSPCSRFEFWRGDPSTGVLSPMPGPKGWEACGAEQVSGHQGRFLVTLHGEIAVPMLVRGKGLEADFFIYGLKQAVPSEVEAPQQMAAKSTGNVDGVPPFCRVRLERKVEITTQGPALCGQFAKQVHDVLYERSYAIGEPVDRMLGALQSRGASLGTAWRAISLTGRTEGTKAELQGRGLTAEQADALFAALFPGASRLWLTPRPDDGEPTFALAYGRVSPDRIRTVLLKIGPDGIRVADMPRALSPSEHSGVSYVPLSYEGHRLLLEVFASGSSMDVGLTTLDPVERLCLLDVRDQDMVAEIEYHPNVRP